MEAEKQETHDHACTAIADYETPCQVCGNLPTVVVCDIETKRIEYHTELCGPCCWGEAECIDPDNW